MFLNWASGWIWVLIGGLFIGTGGVVTTLGWRRIENHQERCSLISSISKDWWLNDYWLNQWPLTESEDPNDIPLKNAPYSIFVISEINRAKTSSLLGGKNSSNIQLILANYEKFALECNKIFDSENELLGRVGDSLGRNEVLNRLKDTRETPPYTVFLDYHKKLGEHLNINYSSIFKKAAQDLFPKSKIIITLQSKTPR